ncbi:hypothetical protein [Methanonatronarchaeum sp. AMET6-2]|uniref:hypothetical protein n=1 Tax=Methanonatronarchaeum sp. AMET6-2 TaxID=2933293 RepID=UPI001FF16F56|nr:hypothetical protein [Methanonatronarchaeum sp. AMET6-2]UOY10012.1 hypothetical protein MU439_07065 [Methanonatronarchaeum sp. AMET6-2]
MNFLKLRSYKSKLKDIREERIDEAISWEKGPNTSEPKAHVVQELPDGTTAYFLKPGKESDRKEGNPHDMTPMVGEDYKGSRFQDQWSKIARLSVIDWEGFKEFLVLLYRNIYFVDHEYIDGGLRYSPDNQIIECIDSLEKRFDDNLFPESGLFGFLVFLDMLAWNEDVKYHRDGSDYNLNDNFDTGRINNMKSAIKLSYELSSFVHSITKCDDLKEVDFDRGFSMMQQLSRTRGTATPNLDELKEWFPEMISEEYPAPRIPEKGMTD